MPQQASTQPSGFSRARRGQGLEEVYREAAEGFFRPEFFNRVDRVVAFSPLAPAAIDRVL